MELFQLCLTAIALAQALPDGRQAGRRAGAKRTNLESMGIFFQATMIPFFIIVKRGPERNNV